MQYTPQLLSRESAHTITLQPVADDDTPTGARPYPVHYWEYQRQTGATGAWHRNSETIVLIHGFRGDHHGLQRLVEQLPEHRIISPDLPGFGDSPAFSDREHSLQSYVQFVADFLRALNLGLNTVLLGHSFGSIIASHFVATHPGAVNRLVLVNPIAAPALEGPAQIGSRLAQLYYWASARLPEDVGLALLRSKLIVAVMSRLMAKSTDPAMLRFVHDQHSRYFSKFANRQSLLEAFTASISHHVGEVAHQLHLPVLLIAGQKDDIATVAAQNSLLRALPDGSLRVISGVGHLIHYETPEPAAAALREFLAHHPAQGLDGARGLSAKRGKDGVA